MKVHERAPALVLVVGLTACGGAKSDAAAPTPPPSSSSAVAPPAASSVPIRINLAEVTWTEAPSMPAGAKIAVIEGDPRKPVFFTMRLKLPAGARLNPHTHPADERVTVLSGSVHVALGEKFDPTKGKTVSAGGFYVNPTPVPHYVWADEECVLQVTGVGPWGVHYLDAPAVP